MDCARFILIYIVQLGIGGIFYSIMGYMILRRDTKNINCIFSSFFISVAIGTVINVIYAAIETKIVVRILNILTYYLFCFGQVFLLLFSLILLKSESEIGKKKQITIITAFAILLLGLFIVGLGFEGVTVNDEWKPVWSLSFLVYSMFLCVPFIIIPTMFYTGKIYKKFRDQKLKKKWKFYLFGICIYFFVWGGTTLSNFLDDAFFRTVWSFIALFGLISTYMIYYGVGKQI
ncbi:MAG: hypothetical protein ACOC44_05570 [Promethearchaeia archaeon]